MYRKYYKSQSVLLVFWHFNQDRMLIEGYYDLFGVLLF